MRLKNLLIRPDVPTKNGRIYPLEILEREIKVYNERERKYQCGVLNANIGYELDHRDISHIISDIILDEDGHMDGELEILPTPSGEILQAFIDMNFKVGFDVKGSSTIENNVIQEDYKILNTYISIEVEKENGDSK